MPRIRPAASFPWILPALPLGLIALGLMVNQARADEGMWTFDQPPLADIQARHGLKLTPEWLRQVQLASVNFGGASGSFVSSRGLVLTNHHVARGCIARLSTPERNLERDGFYAAKPADELRCPGTVLKVLMSSGDVTDAVRAAVARAASPAERNTARKTAVAALERDCQQATALRCQVVPLYGGSLFHVYRYKEWDDVRLVFAPETQAASFGGDADNFVYPRFALDFAFARVYEGGQPAQPPGVLKLAATPVADGDTIFVPGHPGSTDRLRTMAQLRAARDLNLPRQLASLAAQQAMLHDYARQSPEAARQAADVLAGIENRLKAQRGEHAALLDPAVFARKQQEEDALRAGWARLGQPGDPWALVEQAVARQNAQRDLSTALNFGFRGPLANAGGLVELARERALPEAQRLSAYRDTALPQIERQLN
ncbi:S46 family peptidase [Ideonella sp.]|uniref:S46 family peptidase n=1 Tax=Ideonella sp. TaxID=1929293 RepID=UPI003BB6A1FC